MAMMLALWLPVLATAVAIFIVSSLVHMVFKWHLPDYRRLANEDEVRVAINAGQPGPGQYVLPHCSDMKQMQGEAMQGKYREGPVGYLLLRQPGPPAMGKALLHWFLFSLAIATCAGILAAQVYGFGGAGHGPGHLVGVVSFLAYASGQVQDGIWKAQPWRSVMMYLLDALLYGTASALCFWWLWP